MLPSLPSQTHDLIYLFIYSFIYEWSFGNLGVGLDYPSGSSTHRYSVIL